MRKPKRKRKKQQKEAVVYEPVISVFPIRHQGHEMIVITRGDKEYVGCRCGWKSRIATNSPLNSWWHHALKKVKQENVEAHEHAV